jgi:NDP-sugar pyrophosphorylase family protein
VGKAGLIQDLSHITVAILTGGLGTRLRSVIADRPKVLAEVRGRPFLEYVLEQLVGANIQYAVLCTGYLGEQIQSFFGDSYKSLRLAYSQESSPVGTAGALRLAMPLLTSDPVLVMNGDSYCQVNLQAFYTWYCEQCAGGSALLLTRVPDTQRYGRVNRGTDGRVLSFEEKGGKSGPGWINAGIYLLNQLLLSEIPEHNAVSLEQEIFPRWIGRGLYAYHTQGDFLDIGTPQSYAAAEQFFDSEYIV